MVSSLASYTDLPVTFILVNICTAHLKLDMYTWDKDYRSAAGLNCSTDYHL